MDCLVSVITPTYKRAPQIWMKAVSSVLKQTYKNIETTLVDDNDPDSDYRLKNREYISVNLKNENLIYIENTENMGGALARNEGVNNAAGDYIAFLDDDEYIPGDC